MTNIVQEIFDGIAKSAPPPTLGERVGTVALVVGAVLVSVFSMVCFVTGLVVLTRAALGL